MQRVLFIKLLVLSFVFIVIFIGVAATHGLVASRAARRAEATHSVSLSAGGAQLVSGPVLVIPFTRSWTNLVEQRRAVILPKKLSIDATVKTERRSRGIFEATVAVTEHVIRGQFVLPSPLVPLGGAASLQLEAPMLLIGISDTRGVKTPPMMRWGERELIAEPGMADFAGGGFRVPLGSLPVAEGQAIDFELSFTLAGTDSIRWSPAADEVTAKVTSRWPHPSFIGSFLPESKRISNDGFAAEWAINRFATGLPASWDLDARSATTSMLEAPAFGVAVVDPVDVYLLSERATKYGFLFLLLTFGSFFLFELLAGLRIHPMQYGLIGVAQAIFFVLLLALSEHLPFDAAYWIAAAACVGIIGCYAYSVLRSVRRAISFGGGLAVLYGMMSALLHSEDHALLLGATMLFGLTALVMFLTRRVDWYSAGESSSLPEATRS